ncbi:MAG TPA: hypothetical protein PL024_00340 [Thauera sp.]|nr:hypothetical protein [Thauera sp.]
MKQGKRISGAWFYVLFGLAAHGIGAFFEPDVARAAFAAFVDMSAMILPVLGLVFVLMYLAERFLTPERTRAWMGRDSGARGWLLAVAAGMFSTGPAYAWYGLLAELRARGMRSALIAVLLYARAIKLPLLPLLAHYFGVAYMIVLSFFIALFALINGWAMERLESDPVR